MLNGTIYKYSSCFFVGTVGGDYITCEDHNCIKKFVQTDVLSVILFSTRVCDMHRNIRHVGRR